MYSCGNYDIVTILTRYYRYIYSYFYFAPSRYVCISSRVLVMAARSAVGRYISYSKDSGVTWFNTSVDGSLSPQTPCECSIVSMVYEGAYLNTHLYLTAPHSILRDNMTLFSSSDGGYDWSKGQAVIWPGIMSPLI